MAPAESMRFAECIRNLDWSWWKLTRLSGSIGKLQQLAKLTVSQLQLTTSVLEFDFSAIDIKPKAQYTPPTQRNCRVASRRRCVHEFATSSRRLPTDSAITVTACSYLIGSRIVAINLLVCLLNLQIKQTPSSLRIFIREYVNFYNLFNNDVIMSSLVTKPNSSTSQ